MCMDRCNMYNKVYGQVASSVLKTFVNYVNMEQTRDIELYTCTHMIMVIMHVIVRN